MRLAYQPAYDWAAMVALEGGPISARQLSARAEAWRPLRAYGAQHLWTSLRRAD